MSVIIGLECLEMKNLTFMMILLWQPLSVLQDRETVEMCSLANHIGPQYAHVNVLKWLEWPFSFKVVFSLSHGNIYLHLIYGI